MKTIDISKLHIIAKENNSKEMVNRVYVVMATTDGKYDDPETRVAEFDCGYVSSPQPYHQFYKFCCPVPMEMNDEQVNDLKERFLYFPIGQQRKLIHLYDPDIFKRSDPVSSEDAFEYVRQRISLPLSGDEFYHIETGFTLRWNYSSNRMIPGGEYKQAVDHYLTSIESPMDRKKMAQAVDLLLEYLELIGQWGYGGA